MRRPFAEPDPHAAGPPLALDFEQARALGLDPETGEPLATPQVAQMEESPRVTVVPAPPVETVETVEPSADHGLPRPANLPDEFWEARAELLHIRKAAHNRMGSPDALLGAVLARVALTVSPRLRIPPIVGESASLDLCVAIVGNPGSGKTTAVKTAARLLLPELADDLAVVALGSGEGIIEAYFGEVEEVENGKTKLVRRQVRTGVLFRADEGQVVTEMGHRHGTTLLPTIRSAWSGDDLGQANATKDRNRQLGSGEYRFVLVAGFQPEYATALLDDAPGGTPQRFVFFSAVDPAVPDDPPSDPGPLDWKPQGHWVEDLAVAEAIKSEVVDTKRAVARGDLQIGALDEHRLLNRLKVAALLGILDGRVNIDVHDWHLAGLVLGASNRVRDHITAVARLQATLKAQSRIDRAVRTENAVTVSAEARALERMAKTIARHVARRNCAGGCKRRCVTQATSSNQRQLASIEEAIEEARRQHWVELDGDLIRPGSERP